MSMYIKLVGKRLLVIIFVLLVVNNYQGQAQNKDFLQQEINLSIKTGNIFQICGGLAYDGIPIGFEGDINFDVKSPKNIQINDGSLKDILDSIVRQEPRYSWEIRDGVINIYPGSSRSEKIEILLSTNIRSFLLKKESERTEVSKIIYNLDEVNAVLKSKQIQLNIFIRTSIYPDKTNVDINVSNTNLRDILNKIVKNNSDNNFWSIYRTKDETIFLAL